MTPTYITFSQLPKFWDPHRLDPKTSDHVCTLEGENLLLLLGLTTKKDVEPFGLTLNKLTFRQLSIHEHSIRALPIQWNRMQCERTLPDHGDAWRCKNFPTL